MNQQGIVIDDTGVAFLPGLGLRCIAADFILRVEEVEILGAWLLTMSSVGAKKLITVLKISSEMPWSHFKLSMCSENFCVSFMIT